MQNFLKIYKHTNFKLDSFLVNGLIFCLIFKKKIEKFINKFFYESDSLINFSEQYFTFLQPWFLGLIHKDIKKTLYYSIFSNL